jgi:L-lactate dehydrogenase complex protein LldG
MTTHANKAPTLPDMPLEPKRSSARDIDRFVQEAVLVGARVHRCQQSGIRDTVLEILKPQPDEAAIQFEDRELMHLSGWDSAAQKPSGARLSDLRSRNELITRDFEVASVAVGITGADCGLADTGTVVMLVAGQRGRLLSLLPPIHIAILPQDRILPDLGSFLATGPTASSAVIFITGPSKTADIEQRLTTGVHGPGQIHIVIVQPGV